MMNSDAITWGATWNTFRTLFFTEEDMKEIKGDIKDIRVAAQAQEQLTASLDFRIKTMAAEPRPQPGMIALIFSAEGLLLLLLVGGLFYLAGVLQELRLSVDALTARSSDIGARIEGMESALARLGRHLGRHLGSICHI